MEIICGKGPCEQRRHCMPCVSKANQLIAFYCQGSALEPFRLMDAYHEADHRL